MYSNSVETTATNPLPSTAKEYMLAVVDNAFSVMRDNPQNNEIAPIIS
jgi:hypothetical protein